MHIVNADLHKIAAPTATPLRGFREYYLPDLLFCLNSYGRVDFPWREFGGVRHVPSVVRCQAFLQIMRYACVVVHAGGGITKNVDVVEMRGRHVYLVFTVLLLVLWDESPDNEKRERKNISKR